ncbi:hypothetical protein [Caulobacter segnis]|uniref:Uncharacterized protein n=1 Tax=Caulobacter segnis TaxID=88688 RepID=A0A2W5USB6_9CAUL|nr:hypothetical protein [Caulobacter segnis]PZR30699.1 MAG: hypothetical protein DI526_21795 [Caulobacter segnis]
MTKLSTLGASLLVLSLAAPALAEEAKPRPPKVAPAQAAKPVSPKAKPPEVVRRAEDREREAREDRDEKPEKARRHDRD